MLELFETAYFVLDRVLKRKTMFLKSFLVFSMNQKDQLNCKLREDFIRYSPLSISTLVLGHEVIILFLLMSYLLPPVL